MNQSMSRSSSVRAAAMLYGLLLPLLSFAQGSPFQTGADSFVTDLVAIATPIAIVFVMALGIAGHLLLGVRYAARRRAAQHAAEGYLSG